MQQQPRSQRMHALAAKRRLGAALDHLRPSGSDATPAPTAGVVGSVRAAPVIKQVVAQILRLPEVDGAKGDSGQDTLVVRVTTECGLVGFGEVVRASAACSWQPLPRVAAA